MSTKAKMIFGGSCVITAAVIAFVHVSQNNEKEALKVGVQKDIERQERKKVNKAELEHQIALRQQLEKQDRERTS
eukprot:m.244643 g.244643  ORF g.244643 m.244643 type:complete len:75 (-) comp32081_c0_seq1:125-349(-)